jgi:lipoprotein-anchoring transpeptidase ErfK/SrfK
MRRRGKRRARQLLLRAFYVSVLALSLDGAARAGAVIEFPSHYSPGTIVISQSARKLFLIVDPRTAIAYPVAVAKPGMEWSGYARIESKYVAPAWSPPPAVRREKPGLPRVIPSGSPYNPLGARAIGLDRDYIAIHGTSPALRASIGMAASHGCIRMFNEDVIDLYDRVSVGTEVIMTR